MGAREQPVLATLLILAARPSFSSVPDVYFPTTSTRCSARTRTTSTLPKPNLFHTHTNTLEQCMAQCEMWAGPILNYFEFPGADSYEEYTSNPQDKKDDGTLYDVMGNAKTPIGTAESVSLRGRPSGGSKS